MMVLILIWPFPEEAQNARQAEEEREQAKSEMHSWDLPTAGPALSIFSRSCYYYFLRS